MILLGQVNFFALHANVSRLPGFEMYQCLAVSAASIGEKVGVSMQTLSNVQQYF